MESPASIELRSSGTCSAGRLIASAASTIARLRLGACCGSPTRGSADAPNFTRQVQRERAALARRAAQVDLAAKQRGELAADGEAEACAAVLAAGRCVGL